MTTNEQLTWVIDWWMPIDEFRRSIDDMIRRAAADRKVLALPIKMHSGQIYHDFLTLLLSQVHCGTCSAPCCRKNPHDEPFTLLPQEFNRLARRYGREHFVMDNGVGSIPMPCPFLNNSKCTIYHDRPIICVFYPFQPGATDETGSKMIALASDCPEARRITRQVYISAWWIKHQFRLLGEFVEKKGG
jgi:Fe-S-cluster containining protein